MFVRIDATNRNEILQAVEDGRLFAWRKDQDGNQWYRTPPPIFAVPLDDEDDEDEQDDEDQEANIEYD